MYVLPPIRERWRAWRRYLDPRGVLWLCGFCCTGFYYIRRSPWKYQEGYNEAVWPY